MVQTERQRPSRQMPSTRANYVRIGYLEWKHARETLSRLAPPLVKFSRIFPAVCPWIISQLLLRDWLDRVMWLKVDATGHLQTVRAHLSRT